MKPLLEWTVIGAGPAGIASIGKLLDAGVTPKDILWVDPHFTVGDFGTSWRYVNSNTAVEYFLNFYQQCEAFCYNSQAHPPFMIDQVPLVKNCPLMLAAQPLLWMTKCLSQQVNVLKDTVIGLTPVNHHWQLQLSSRKRLHTKKIILAIGANAKELHFANTASIPLKTALNPTELKKMIEPQDYVIVFGSAQSAKSVIENLTPLETKKKLLFYRSENSLHRHFSEDDLTRIESLKITPQRLLAQMPHCTKAIYAIGFERRHISITGLPENYGYDHKTGEVAPGIFGLGIAFPEIMPYELGQIEYPVTAIWPVMKRLNKLMPQWLS